MIFSFILPFISSISKFFSSTLASISPYSKAPNCDVEGCKNSAYYIFNPTGYKEIKFCDTHKNQVEFRAQYGALFHPDVAQSVVSAYEDLLKAVKIDPSSNVIHGNLKQAREFAEIVLGRKLE